MLQPVAWFVQPCSTIICATRKLSHWFYFQNDNGEIDPMPSLDSLDLHISRCSVNHGCTSDHDSATAIAGHCSCIICHELGMSDFAALGDKLTQNGAEDDDDDAGYLDQVMTLVAPRIPIFNLGRGARPKTAIILQWDFPPTYDFHLISSIYLQISNNVDDRPFQNNWP